MTKHAKLSASSSHRWIACPGSVKAEENFPYTYSKYADEGTLAHEIAAKILNKEDISHLTISSEMNENIQIYIDYINQIAPQEIWHPIIHIEKQVRFSHIVPGGFGTADAIVIANNHLHIIDFKYGIGNSVGAYENTQLLLYAIGMHHEIKDQYKIDNISLHIVQPRITNFDKWTISPKELAFFEGYIKAKAENALQENAIRIPSEEACKWCRANSSCPALYDFTSNIIELDKEIIDNNKLKNILDNSKMIKNFLSSVENKIFTDLSTGNSFPGYKLVAGRNVRKFKTNSNDKLVELLGEKAYTKHPIKVTDLEKIVDSETLKSFIYISKCKPLLVTEDDKRKALVLEELNFDPVEDDPLS